MKLPVRASCALAVLVVAACQGDPTAPATRAPSLNVAAASKTVDEVIELPVNLVTFVPCALNGVGEDVILTGSVRITSSVKISASGNATVRSQYSPRHIVGTGVTSGDTYHGNGVTINSFSGPVGKEQMTVNNFQVIGQGPGNNFRVHELIAVTVNANGTTSNVIIRNRFSCQ